jgi:hypothetical protein
MPFHTPSLTTAIRLAIATLLTPVCLVAQEAPLARTRAAFARADVAGTESAAKEVLATDTAAEHRREALVLLANLARHVRRDSAGANEYLRQALALPLPVRRAGLLAESARCKLSFGDLAGAADDARAALDAAWTMAVRTRARVVLSEATLALLDAGRADAGRLKTLIAELGDGVREAPGETSGAWQLVLAAARAHDGPALLAGWRSYYLMSTNGGATNVLAGPRDALERLLPRWSAASADTATQRAIVYALADSRMFEPAARLAGERRTDGTTLAATDAQARDIVAWARFIADARRATDDFYRQTALKSAHESAWRDSVTAAARAAWLAFTWPAEPPRFDFDAFREEVERRFGAITPGFGSTGGFADLHFGHSVDDERHAVTQYGHTAAFRFVQLDAMISNGFLSWFWDGASVDGGWQNTEMVVQVRPAYASNPLTSWFALTDSAQRRLIDDQIAADSISDLARARTTPVAYFPSVVNRLTRRGGLALLDSLRRTGLTGDALRERFVRVLSDEIQEYSIFQHEGRHAIDKGVGADGNCGAMCKLKSVRLSGAELEFGAKLSQVTFALRPELALSGIMSPSIGDQTPHGTADARIMHGLLDWMGAHAGEIANLDRSAPLLPQLPLLTSAQLRSAFRSMDPLAKGG